jgi:PAS domain S-box-containing protein
LLVPLGLVTLAAWGVGSVVVALILPSHRASVAAGFSAGLAVLLLGVLAATLWVIRRLLRRHEVELQNEQARRSRLIVDAAADAIITFTHEGHIESFNKAASRLFGYTSEEVIGKNIGLLIGTSTDGTFNSSMQKVLQTGGARILTDRATFHAQHKDGQLIPVEMGVSKVLDEDRRVYIQIIRDLRERMAVEEQLRRARDAAEVASRAKSEFLANVGHETRTPLTGILGLTELMLESPLTPQQREILQLIQASANTLLALINDLLDHARIEAARMVLEAVTFELRPGLDPALKTLAVRARQKNLAFSWDISNDVPPVLVGDPLRLQQVILNLVGNAIKFTASGEVSFRMLLAERSGNDVILHGAVRDTGIGIPPEKQETIFEAFSQLDSSATRKEGGTGLGLAITSRLVELMNGKLWVESAPGQGSTFHFTVQLRVGEPSSRQASTVALSSGDSAVRPPAGPPVLGKEILVAEDNAVNRALVDLILQKRQHKVTFVSSGREVVSHCETKPFDLVLMDVGLPEMDGLVATGRILARCKEQGRTLPIVALTAFAGEEDRQRCLQAGMSAYLTKPVHPDELLRVIDDLLRTK